MHKEQAWLEEDIFQIKDLSDIDSGSGEISKEFVEWLGQNIPHSQVKTELPRSPDGTMGFLVPKTSVAIRLPKLTWGLIKTLASAAWISWQKDGSLNGLVGGGFTLADGIQTIRKATVKLKPNRGQVCSYKSVVDTCSIALLAPNRQVPIEQLWNEHKTIRTSCHIGECQFHQGGCEMSRTSYEKTLEDLTRMELLTQDGQNIEMRW